MMLSRSTDVTVGGDPEGFLVDQHRGALVPAIGRIGGTKGNPVQLQHGGVQEDNVMVELNIIPAEDSTTFSNNVEKLYYEVDNIVRQSGLMLSMKAAGKFLVKDLKSKQAQQFGCSPDFNAYTGESNKYPTLGKDSYRYAGGHIHIGISGPTVTDELRRNVVKWMDFLIGLPSVFFDSNQASNLRRALYGKSGNYRPTSYGLEYRTPSNFWVTQDKHFIHDATRLAAKIGSEVEFTIENGCDSTLLQTAINDGNGELAEYLVQSSLLTNKIVRGDAQYIASLRKNYGPFNRE